MVEFTKYLRSDDPDLASWRSHFESRGIKCVIKSRKPYKGDRHRLYTLCVDVESPSFFEVHGWRRAYENGKQRCENPKFNKYSYYGGRGIKFQLTKAEVRMLWERDRAAKMVQPSIDRIDADGHYTFDNCRFIEMDENRRRRHFKAKVENTSMDKGSQTQAYKIQFNRNGKRI